MLRRLASVGLLLLGCACLFAQHAPLALAQTTTVTFTPPPTPSPSPSPSPAKLETVHGGPITFSVNGSLQFGAHYLNTTNGGIPTVGTPSPSASPTNPIQALQQSQSQSLTTQNAGFVAQVGRRTATTATTVALPVGFGSGGTQFGALTAAYSTPKYSFEYGPQPLVLFGQLPLGSTLRGLALIVPAPFGDETLYEGPAIGAQSDILRLWGLRFRGAAGSTFYEAGISSGDGQFTGKSRTLTFGGAHTFGALGIVGEAAWQERSGGDGSPHGLAFQLQLNDEGSSGAGFSTTVRHMPYAFVAYGAGEIYGDNYLDTNWHAEAGSSQFAVDANWEHIGTSPTEIQSTRTDSLIYGLGLGRIGGMNVSLMQLSTIGGGQSDLTNSAVFQTAFGFAQMNETLGLNLTRSVQNPAGVTAVTSMNAGLQRQFGLYGLALNVLTQRTTQSYNGAQLSGATGTPASGPTTQTTESFGLTRLFGKTGVGISGTITHTVSPTSNAIQKSPLISVSRQISPVITVQTSYGFQTLTDRLNPQSDGRTRVFTFQINAPFSFGSGITTGRIDPRLPATIVGRVQAVSTGGGPLAGLASVGALGGGLGNVLVTLDGRYMQRTDLTGGFQFSFVPAGQHQLRIETSSLPPGLTVDQPVASVTLQGGQVSQVLFQVGNFGGIIGHVYGTSSSGQPVPLPGVQVRIDNGRYSQTDASGAFGFGGLQQGPHTVEVIENTVPAYATFDPKQLTQTVQVHNGGYTKIDFSAVPLGSISGKVVYSPEMLPLKGGVPNVYVVAEPGDHAAIDDDDGSYIIDNLPPGDYTVSVDPETLPEGAGAKPDSQEAKLEPGRHVHGIDFSAGRFEKKVVFTFVAGSAGATSAVEISESRLPPRGTTGVTVHAPENAAVTVNAFNKTTALTYDKSMKAWVGEIAVPEGTKAGDYTVSGSVSGAAQPSAATLKVDPKIPLAILNFSPHNATKGQYVLVRARFLVDVRPGDQIVWQDGQKTTLGKPVAGRVFTFSVVLSLRPLHGVLLTRTGKLPIELL